MRRSCSLASVPPRRRMLRAGMVEKHDWDLSKRQNVILDLSPLTTRQLVAYNTASEPQVTYYFKLEHTRKADKGSRRPRDPARSVLEVSPPRDMSVRRRHELTESTSVCPLPPRWVPHSSSSSSKVETRKRIKYRSTQANFEVVSRCTYSSGNIVRYLHSVVRRFLSTRTRTRTCLLFLVCLVVLVVCRSVAGTRARAYCYSYIYTR